MTENNLLHEVDITAIVIKNGKYLITRRSLNKKRLPGKWTVPGGHLEKIDYTDLPNDIENGWYNVLERALKREVKEETGINIKNIEYVTSLVVVYGDGNPTLIISCLADYVSGKIVLQEGETDKHAWVSLKEAKKYDLIDGIYDELIMIEKKRKGKKVEWKRFTS
jgi:8-oxo-dGTP pyrophosphatase MutT (NUDIX family)